MIVTLRRAAQIRNAIEKAIQETRLTPTMEVSIHAPDIPQAVEVRRAELVLALAKVDTLEDILYRLRGAIATANQLNGVDGLLTRRARLEAKVRRLSAFKDLEPTDIETVVRQAESEREGKTEAARSFRPFRLGASAAEIPVQVLDQPTLDLLRRDLAETRRALEGINETLLRTNLEGEVEISKEDMDYLTRERVI